MADAEHGTQGQADSARGEAGGGNRALTHTRLQPDAEPYGHSCRLPKLLNFRIVRLPGLGTL